MLRPVMFGREKLVHISANTMKEEMKFHVVPITEDGDMLSLGTESVKQDDASGPNSIQCSLQVHVQEVHHGTASTDGSVKRRHNSLKQRSRSSGRCGKCLRLC